MTMREYRIVREYDTEGRRYYYSVESRNKPKSGWLTFIIGAPIWQYEVATLAYTIEEALEKLQMAKLRNDDKLKEVVYEESK